MTSDQIRELFLNFMVERDHKRIPSGSLVPADYDPSVLLTTAGMHPLKPYFLGQEKAPHHRLTSVQKCFRTPDIEEVGTTTRHLTFFEMLGNFSIGDYFKQGAVEFAWDLTLNGFGFDPEKVWITVFEGDEQLGLGPDEEAIEAWLAVGVPRERIVGCPRSENFWQAGPIGPCGPCSELYFDRGLEFGKEDDLPGGENERFLEFWNLVFMQYLQDPVNVLTPLPAQNIDTGMGLNRMAALLQGVESVFDTDQFVPLIQLGEQLSGKRYAAGDAEVDRSLRILADHTRGSSFLIADGVVPSNEDRGYVLRRVMRRAIQHGRRLGMDPGFLTTYSEVVRETMGGAYSEIGREWDAIQRWLKAEEELFGRTLERGTKRLDDLIAQAKENGDEGITKEDAFQLHDTFGFPIEMTMEIAAEHGLGVSQEGFELLMEEQRRKSRGGFATAGVGGDEGPSLRDRALAVAKSVEAETEFTGYETLEQHTTVGAVEELGEGRYVAKLAESPFYATGGGQVADVGVVECDGGDCRARVTDVVRLGSDQAVVLEVEQGILKQGERIVARVSSDARHATQANHTATHLLHAALRERLGTHVRQAGSYVGPDKLRFDFTHGQGLSREDIAWVEDKVNAEILRAQPVRALTMPLEEARALGAMALFGEKYGDVVRMVQIGDGSYSRELCGGTHVRTTAEIGVFKLTAETSSAANVRRIEALTGPGAVAYFREHDRLLSEAATLVRKRPEEVPAAIADLQAKAKASKKAAAPGGAGSAIDVDQLVASAVAVDGDVKLLTAELPPTDPKALPDLADQLKSKLGGAGVVVLGTVNDGRVGLIVAVPQELVGRGLKAGDIVKQAAQVVGGGGGGRPTMAQAGGKDPEKLGEALAAARAAVESALGA